MGDWFVKPKGQENGNGTVWSKGSNFSCYLPNQFSKPVFQSSFPNPAHVRLFFLVIKKKIFTSMLIKFGSPLCLRSACLLTLCRAKDCRCYLPSLGKTRKSSPGHIKDGPCLLSVFIKMHYRVKSTHELRIDFHWLGWICIDFHW